MANPTTAPPALSLPGPEDVARRALSNGLVVLARENWASPAVVVQGYLRVGSADEAPAQGGLAAFTAALLTRGTARRSFQDIAESVEAVGATLGVRGGLQASSFGGKCLQEDLPMLLDLIADVLQSPSFPPEHVERVRGEILNGIRQRDTNPHQVAQMTFRRLAYPDGHVYGRPVAGHRDTVTALSRDDLTGFYSRHFGPQGGILVVVGAAKAEWVLDEVERLFGGWAGAPARLAPPPPPQALPTHLSERVALPGKIQSDIVLGGHGLERRHPDYIPAEVMNLILGEQGIGGRLGDIVREQQGLAYYVGSRFEAGVGAGPWYAYAGVNPRNVEQAVDSILTEVRRIRATPVTDEELADAQAYLTGSLPIHLETNEGVAGELLEIELYDLGLDYLRRYPALINAVTVEQVQAMAEKWLNPDVYALAVAGP